jgi:hypothetical protein
VIFIVLLNFDLLDLSTDFVQSLILEDGFIELFIIGLDEEHILPEHTDILETT